MRLCGIMSGIVAVGVVSLATAPPTAKTTNTSPSRSEASLGAPVSADGLDGEAAEGTVKSTAWSHISGPGVTSTSNNFSTVYGKGTIQTVTTSAGSVASSSETAVSVSTK